MGMRKNNDKEIYRLWYEFLKRSFDYREYCEWKRKRQRNKILQLPAKFTKYNGLLKHHVVNTYDNFDDIHAINFDTWWKSFQVRRAGKQAQLKEKKERPIEAFSDYFGVHAECCIEHFQGKFDRQPTLEEFVKYFPLWLEKVGCYVYTGTIILMVRILREDPIALSCDFKKIVTKNKKRDDFPITVAGDPLWFNLGDVIARNRLEPTTNYLRIDELKRYLEIYDLKTVKKMNFSEIIKTFNRDYTDLHVKRAFHMDYEKAKRIIGYAEWGFFPGNYEKAAPKKRKAKIV